MDDPATLQNIFEIRELGSGFSPLMPGHENIVVLKPYSANRSPRGAWRTSVSVSAEKVFRC